MRLILFLLLFYTLNAQAQAQTTAISTNDEPGSGIKQSLTPEEAAAEELIQEDIDLHEAGEYDAAIEKYEDALKLRPEWGLAYYEISYA